MIERILSRLRDFEGWRDTAYVDTTGHVTIGYGFNLGAILLPLGATFHPKRVRINPVQRLPRVLGEQWITMILAGVIEEIQRRAPFWGSMDEVRREVLVDLVYNIGSKVLSYPTFMRQLAERDYAGAADNMAGWTGWAPVVGPRRAGPLIRMMRTGVAE